LFNKEQKQEWIIKIAPRTIRLSLSFNTLRDMRKKEIIPLT
jgi:hypothetical protein